MSRASLKELQSLALFGWDRQHDHAPNGERLNMPSHDEVTQAQLSLILSDLSGLQLFDVKFARSGFERCQSWQPCDCHCMRSGRHRFLKHGRFHKSCVLVQHTKFYQTGRQRRKRSSSNGHVPSEVATPAHPSKSKPRRASGLPTTRRAPASKSRKGHAKEVSRAAVSCGDEHLQGKQNNHSPMKTSSCVNYAVQSTPLILESRDGSRCERDRVSSQSTPGN